MSENPVRKGNGLNGNKTPLTIGLVVIIATVLSALVAFGALDVGFATTKSVSALETKTTENHNDLDKRVTVIESTVKPTLTAIQDSVKRNENLILKILDKK